MKGARASMVYNAPACGWRDVFLARITLIALFFLTLAYVIIVPILFYYGWTNGWAQLIIVALASTTLWARGPWGTFGKARVFEAWRRYFTFKVWREEPRFDRKRNVLLAVVPHGLFPLTLPLLSGVQEEFFPELQLSSDVPIRTAVANVMLWTPILAPMLRWLGCIAASKANIVKALDEGTCIVIPDGMAGAFHSDSAEERVYIQSRTGFIRTVIQQGALLVPVYCFGHTQLWDVWPSHDSWIAHLSRRFQFSLIWFWGEWWMPPLPRRVPLTMVIGKGIPITKNANPSAEQVKEVHQLFSQSLCSLYARYRSEAGGEYTANKHILIV